MKELENNITSKTYTKNKSVFFQPKLTINQPNDIYEQEADSVAEQVMRMPINKNENSFFKPVNIHNIQRKCAECEEKKLQRKENSNGEIEASNDLQNYSGGLNSGGIVLPSKVRTFFEPRFGHDFSNVRIHNNMEAANSAQSINALAYTIGNNIVFNQNQYSPETDRGKNLLAHELTHVVQQKGVTSQSLNNENEISVSSILDHSILQRKECDFYVYDSTEETNAGLAWKLLTFSIAFGKWGVYDIASGDSIENMIEKISDQYFEGGCDCISRIEFWSHGSSGNAMSISKTNDEITKSDFDIPNLDKFGILPPLSESSDDSTSLWWNWFKALSNRQRHFILLRSLICHPDATIYYRSCEAFRGKDGQEFAKASTDFWQVQILGHTKVIALSQPGLKSLKPGQDPYWPETEGSVTSKKPIGVGADHKPK